MIQPPIAALALAFLLVSSAAGAEKTIQRKDVPAPVLSAFAKAWPAAKAVRFAKEPEKGRALFEIESREGSVARDVLFAPDGTVVEVEETVPVSALPAPVLAAVEKMGPGVAIRKAEKVTAGNVITWDLELKGAKVSEVSLDGSGAPARR